MIKKGFEGIIDIIKRNQVIVISLVLLILSCVLVGYKYNQWTERKNDRISDQFVKLYRQNGTDEEILSFTNQYWQTMYADLLSLKLAKSYFDQKEDERCVALLKEVYKRSSRKVIRSIAAYRIANLLKEKDPARAIKYAEKIESKAIRAEGSLVKAESFIQQREIEKAMIELDSILSSNSIREGKLANHKTLLELANQQKRKLMSQYGIRQK